MYKCAAVAFFFCLYSTVIRSQSGNAAYGFGTLETWAYIHRRDSIMVWSVILSVYGAGPTAEFKLWISLSALIS
jgi:hypothetical protein